MSNKFTYLLTCVHDPVFKFVRVHGDSHTCLSLIQVPVSVVAFLSSVYLGSYWWLNMGNLNMLIERGKKQACLNKGSYAWCHTRWRGLESHILI